MRRALVALLFGITASAATIQADGPRDADGVAMPDPMPARRLRTLSRNPAGYDPGRPSVPRAVLLGDLLFHSPDTLGDEAQGMGLSCNGCHPNGATNARLRIEGISDRAGNVDLTSDHFHAGAGDGVDNAVNIPSLRGARYTAPYGVDGRAASLRHFIRGVVTREFGGQALPPRRLSALVAYVRELDFMPNPQLDAENRLRASASDKARAGERLFHAEREGLGGRSCASCHVPSTFFRDGRAHRHRSGERASPYSLDDGYETPTLLGTTESAPYFHDGSVDTLAGVVAWYDETFGLQLDETERGALAAYLQAVGDVEHDRDRRPLGPRLVHTLAYLDLLVRGETRDERDVWAMAIDAVLTALAEPEPAGPIRARLGGLTQALRDVRARCASGEDLPPLRDEVRRLIPALERLAADWTGALAKGTSPETR